jgi:hypothetical protein
VMVVVVVGSEGMVLVGGVVVYGVCVRVLSSFKCWILFELDCVPTRSCSSGVLCLSGESC